MGQNCNPSVMSTLSLQSHRPALLSLSLLEDETAFVKSGPIEWMGWCAFGVVLCFSLNIIIYSN